MRKIIYLLSVLAIFVFTSFYISCNVKRNTGVEVNITGNWQVMINVAEGPITGKGLLEQKGNLVTGWVGASETDPIPVTGTFQKGTLILETLPQPGRTVAFDKVDLTIEGETMSGIIEQGSHGKGTIKFIRVR